MESQILGCPDLSKSFYHPKLLGLKRNGEQVEFKMEFLEDIPKFMKRIYKKPYFEEEFSLHSARFMIDSLISLHNLHFSSYVHGDISPRNIGLSRKDGKWKIFDFGQSFLLTQTNEERSGGTSDFRDPLHYNEEAGLGIFCKEADLFSLMKTFVKAFTHRLYCGGLCESSDPLSPLHSDLNRIAFSVVNSEIKKVEERPSLKECLRSLLVILSKYYLRSGDLSESVAIASKIIDL